MEEPVADHRARILHEFAARAERNRKIPLELLRSHGSDAVVVSATKLVVFDMAGTTVHDEGMVLECFVAAAGTAGLIVTRAEINDRMGLSKLQVFDELARRQLEGSPESEILALRDRGYESFQGLLEASYDRGGVAPIEGADRVFAWLRQHGISIALNTGFYRRVTDIIIARLGWRDQVDAVITVDDVAEGRPAPYMIHSAMQRCRVRAVGEVAVVGDTPSDVIAGRNSGARAVIGVTSGSHDARALRRYGATQVLESVREIPAAIARIDRLERSRPVTR